jgi:hypothetical protein
MLHSKIKDDFYNMVIFDDDVKNIISYTPNFLVKYHDRTECIEIRTFYETQRADFKEKVNVLKNNFRKVGIEFTVVTENVIRETHRYLNNNMLIAALRHPSPVKEFEEIKTHIPRCNLSTQKLGKCIAKYGFKPCFIRRALAHKLIKADMSVHWSDININW